MRIVVLGAGAVGAYYGGQLARSGHAVTCFARGANLAAMREHGLEIRTPEGAFRPHLAATDRIDELGPADFAILAVKSYSLSAIAPVVRRVAAIAAAFREAGVEARTSDRIVVELWQKFVFISALAAACGLARSPIGSLRTSVLGRRLLERAVSEVIQVGQARGIPLPPNEAARVLALIDSLPAGMRPSFLLDLEAGGQTELDILSGAVSRFADQAGVTTPVHDAAAAALAPRAQLPSV